MNKPSAPIILLLAGVLPAPVLMAFVATLLRQQRGTVDPPTWMQPAVIAATVFSVVLIVYWLLAHRLIASAIGQRLQDKGIDAGAYVGLAGMAVFLVPACIALFLAFAGLPLPLLYTAAAFSLLGLLFWAWWYWFRRAR